MLFGGGGKWARRFAHSHGSYDPETRRPGALGWSHKPLNLTVAFNLPMGACELAPLDFHPQGFFFSFLVALWDCLTVVVDSKHLSINQAMGGTWAGFFRHRTTIPFALFLMRACMHTCTLPRQITIASHSKYPGGKSMNPSTPPRSGDQRDVSIDTAEGVAFGPVRMCACVCACLVSHSRPSPISFANQPRGQARVNQHSRRGKKPNMNPRLCPLSACHVSRRYMPSAARSFRFLPTRH